MICVIISYVFILIFAFFFYILYIDTVSLFLLIFLIVLPIISGILFHLFKKKVKFSLCSDYDTVLKSNHIGINLIIQNSSPIPFALGKVRIKYTNKMSEEVSFFNVKAFIPPRNSVKISMGISSQYCGCVRAEIVKTCIYDMMLMSFHKEKEKSFQNISCQTEVTVMPTLIESLIDNSGNNFESDESDVMSKTKKGDDPSEVFDMHKYVYGDRLNRVHWKLTARLDEVFVKDYSMPINNTCYIIFDADSSEKKDINDFLKCIDTCLEGLMSFSFNFINNNIPHKIVFYNKEYGNYQVVEITEIEECYTSVNYIIKNCGTTKGIIEEFILNELENKRGRIFYFTPTIKDNVLNLLEMYSESFKPIVITTSDKAEVVRHEESDVVIYKVIPGDFSRSFDEYYL